MGDTSDVDRNIRHMIYMRLVAASVTLQHLG